MSAALSAEPITAFDAQRLFTSASHIAVVEVTSDESWAEDASMAAMGTVGVRTQYRLRGDDLPDQLTIALTRRGWAFSGETPLYSGLHVIVFLTRSADGRQWTLGDPYYGLFRVSTSRPEDHGVTDVREVVLAELRNSLDDPDNVVVRAALRALLAFRDHAAISKARNLSQSDDARTAARAIMLRLSVGDRTALTDAVELFEPGLALTTSEKDLLAWSIADKDARVGVSDLNRLLLNSDYPTLRRAAATALSERGDRTSLPALAVGLSDSDRETQYRSVVALSRITGRSSTGYREFMVNPDPTVNYWKLWLESQRVSK
jgi:hypothetical protein